ncbi:MAG: hypothetical protein EXR92_01160 [Gemmatimonadetes bacterium]|nr:hypothetical protein [Gemmatimonadota bacterium]
MFRTHSLLVAVLVLGVIHPTAVQAQLVDLRSVPVASGDQFLIYPSQRLGMGSPSIALTDRWQDPFVNPAKGAALTESAFFVSPTFYGISGDNGGGKTLPLAVLFTGSDWFGGGTVAIQQIENREQQTSVIFWDRMMCCWPQPQPQRLDEGAARNVYLHTLAGRRLNESVAFGASLAYASIGAVDGVDLLYQGSDGVDESGHLVDARVGLSGKDSRDGDFELLLLYHRLDMRHDIRYIEWRWIEEEMRTELFVRDQTEWDDSRSWGVHGAYDRPIAAEGWRAGGLLTVNRKDHPKIPNYALQNIPRDPGESWAFEMGMGLSKSTGPLQVGLDVVLEPIWSQTWSVLDSTVVRPDSSHLKPGDNELENEFFFRNVHIRFGIGRDAERWGVQLGLLANSYGYELEQFNNVDRSRRQQDESWMEWTPTWGANIRFPEVEVRYSGRLATGTGLPGVDFVGARAKSFAGADFIVAPSGPLTLQDVHVLTHQITVSLPIR